jgi:hypothetical protein
LKARNANMSKAARNIMLAAVILLVGARGAAAHISLESTDSLWIRPTGIDVRIYMSRGSADAVIAADGEVVTIVRDNFEDFQKRLSAAGPGLLMLTNGDGTKLKADSSMALLTEDNDICFELHFPLPRELPGLLRLHANYLSKMDEGHVGDIHVLNATDDQLAQGEIRVETPDYEVQLPAVAGVQVTAPASRAVIAAAPAPAEGSHGGTWIALGGALLVFGGVAIWRIVRERKRGGATNA